MAHDKLADERIAVIMSKQPKKQASTATTPTRASSSSEKDAGADGICHIVKCPKGHVSALHITRHSSFRCDICGSGVERGRPMHGCRECDWDACEGTFYALQPIVITISFLISFPPFLAQIVLTNLSADLSSAQP